MANDLVIHAHVIWIFWVGEHGEVLGEGVHLEKARNLCPFPRPLPYASCPFGCF